MKNKVLVIGSGGREHALAWRLSLSDTVSKVFVAPGNPGTAMEENIENLAIAADDYDKQIDFCLQERIDLVVVGPEQPLCDGIVDQMQQVGIKCFGPTASAAMLEGSKTFSKNFLQKYQIPTAEFEGFTDVQAAKKYLHLKSTYPIVIKADGLAAGKGVVVAHSKEEAESSVVDMLAGNAFGDAGHRIIIEDFLKGEEASFIVMADGENFISMATSQDHKARDDGDKGPNTGGMGAYSPAPVVTESVYKKTLETIIKPTIEGMKKEGTPFTGFLYAGLMIDDETPKVLEFNVRFGDPETQPIMMRLLSNLDQLCLAAIEGNLDQQEVKWDDRSALGVVLAERGYPDKYDKGSVIEGLDIPHTRDVKVFQAGTAIQEGKIVTNGGRVLCACALGKDIKEAADKAYVLADTLRWDSKYCRTDIGFKALR